MKAFVMGPVDDERTKIPLNTVASISVIGESFARKRKLKGHRSTE